MRQLHWATADRQIKQIGVLLDDLHEWSARQQSCKRKNVGFALVLVDANGAFKEIHRAHNGSSQPGVECSNIVGGCGCAHSEPRVLMKCLADGWGRHMGWSMGAKCVMIGTYSPCSWCANCINDSGIVDACIYDRLTEHDPRGVEIMKNKLPGGVLSRAELTNERFIAWYKGKD